MLCISFLAGINGGVARTTSRSGLERLRLSFLARIDGDVTLPDALLLFLPVLLNNPYYTLKKKKILFLTQ